MPVPIESRTIACQLLVHRSLTSGSLTQMQMKARIQPSPTPMFDQILRRFPGSQILVALPYRVVFAATVVAIGHQHGDLCAQFGQLKWA